ncbi:MAG TPA: hypothetical protein VM925_01505 [Labilithrix sp.]|nr:hypothetical protein [Labilithrix sp.]
MAAQTFRSRNRLALALLVVGKLLGIAGLVVGSAHRFAGGLLLGFDGLLIVVAVGVSLRTMKAREAEDSGHKELLRQMMNEGTLKQYLRDLEAERESEGAGPSAPADASIRTS